MNINKNRESGFVGEMDIASAAAAGMTDVEVLNITSVNVVARGRRYGRRWLLKALIPELAQSTAHQRRLVKEFEIQSRLSDPSVARAIGMEEVEGLGLCIVTEWVQGRTLAELTGSEKLSLRQRRQIMEEIVTATAHLHRNGIVHRDLKPSNIMVRNDGHIVLIDFGLADTSDYVELKQSAGTPGYISPEQLANGGADPADDVYSLGVIMGDLCPEDRRIAKRCKAPAKVRPADARALLTLIERRRLGRRRMLVSVAVALAVAALVYVGYKFNDMYSDARLAGMTINALQTDNRHDAERINLLNDSLENMKRNFADLESKQLEAERLTAVKEEATKNGYAAIDAVLNRYDKLMPPIVDSGEMSRLTELIDVIHKDLNHTAQAYCTSLPVGDLTQDDIDALLRDLYHYSAIAFDKYINRWLEQLKAKAFAQHAPAPTDTLPPQ